MRDAKRELPLEVVLAAHSSAAVRRVNLALARCELAILPLFPGCECCAGHPPATACREGAFLEFARAARRDATLAPDVCERAAYEKPGAAWESRAGQAARR